LDSLSFYARLKKLVAIPLHVEVDVGLAGSDDSDLPRLLT